MAKEDIKRYSAEQLKDMVATGDYYPTPEDAPTHELDESFWENAYVVSPEGKRVSVHLRLEPEVFDFFKQGGKGHLTRMAAVLRAYVEAKKRDG